jgi:hypothetical protein
VPPPPPLPLQPHLQQQQQQQQQLDHSQRLQDGASVTAVAAATTDTRQNDADNASDDSYLTSSHVSTTTMILMILYSIRDMTPSAFNTILLLPNCVKYIIRVLRVSFITYAFLPIVDYQIFEFINCHTHISIYTIYILYIIL